MTTNKRKRQERIWNTIICIAGAAMFFMILSRIDFLLFGVAP